MCIHILRQRLLLYTLEQQAQWIDNARWIRICHRKYQKIQNEISTNNFKQWRAATTPKRFFVLNYLGLTQIQSQNITVPQPYAGPFFGKLVWHKYKQTLHLHIRNHLKASKTATNEYFQFRKKSASLRSIPVSQLYYSLWLWIYELNIFLYAVLISKMKRSF